MAVSLATKSVTETDERISTNVRMLMARDQSHPETIAPVIGISMQTMYRRLKVGGWTAAEVELMAKHFGRSVASMYVDPGKEAPVTDRKGGSFRPGSAGLPLPLIAA